MFEYLGIDKIPEGHCVHHRDCNVDNNDKENLVILSNSDHRWIHKQYGSSTLWAYYYNKVTLIELVEWSNDKDRAKRLIPLNIIGQKDNNN